MEEQSACQVASKKEPEEGQVELVRDCREQRPGQRERP